jgi:hypothetical protein
MMIPSVLLILIVTKAFFPTIIYVPLLDVIDIFRPFVGYKEVRLVSKEARQVSG